MSDDELDLIETEDLLDVLERRFKGGVVLVGLVDRGDGTTNTHCYYRVGLPIALGLIRYADVVFSRVVDKEDES